MRLSPSVSLSGLCRVTSAALGVVLLLGVCAPAAFAQVRNELPDFLFDPTFYSRRDFEKKIVMDGNEVAITAFNYGLLGGVGEVRGNWPKGSQDFYVGDVLPVLAAEVPIDLDGDAVPDTLVRHIVTTRGPGNRGIPGPPGQPGVAWTMEAKPGFASDRERTDTGESNDRLAVSTDDETWPDFWPDQPTWFDPSSGEVQWNGFFGRDQFNADLESYFWADDNNDRELQDRFNFQPDATRPERGGLGLDMKVRGLQWSQFLAQDAIFWLYEITNTSTTTYPRVSVGLTAGTLAGGDGDSQDDLAFFDQANRIVYSWDFNNRGNQGQEVGYVGYGFLESPGNDDNAIDDDGDADPLTDLGMDLNGLPYVNPALAGSGNTFMADDFEPRMLAAGDPLVLIDEETGERTIEYIPASGTITVTSQGRSYTLGAGSEIFERQITITSQSGIDQVVTEKNLVDDDLDGLIDEDITLHFERRAQAFSGEIITLPSLRFVDYVGFGEATQGRTPTAQDSTNFGLKNPLIDEARDDGVDNDGDWQPSDDVGADGQPGTGDAGEGDGQPSPGEPNFDALDVTESDQVGLSSFFYFVPSNAFPLSNSQRVWDGMTPGFFTTNEELASQQQAGGVDGDFVFGSGYFSLEPGETIRFTLALVFGNDLEDITTNAITIQEIYDRNYQFARPPDRPTLNAVPGDGQVTLYWDSAAEQSVDPILGEDFQGYRLYKSTDPFFRDVEVVTDAFGNNALRVPYRQFDRDDGIEGLYVTDDPRVRGVPYNLGEDTGLRYSVVDSLVSNGQRYYYALTAYDSGSPDFFPAESDFPVSIREDGSIFTGQNVVEVIPNAPVSGYVEGRVVGEVTRLEGFATGEVFAQVLDPRMLQENAQYRVTFSDDEPASDSFYVARDGMPVASGTIENAASVIFDGLRVVFNNDMTRIDVDSTGWQDPDGLIDTFTGVVNVVEWRFFGEAVPYDYVFTFADEAVGMSIGGFPLGNPAFGAPTAVAGPTNFTVRNATLGEDAEFVFFEPTASRNGVLDAGGELVFLFEDIDGTRTPTFIFRARQNDDGTFGLFPSEGDTFTLATRKPFSQRDQYALSTVSSAVDDNLAQDQLDRIRVVPNPYVAAASWERPLPPTVTTGRGERRIDFIHLPAGATVRIFDVRGALIRELVHDGAIDDGTVSWDLRTRENLEAAYGIYYYHVEAPGVGERTGQLALIK